MNRAAPLVAALALAGCAASSTVPAGRYIGTSTPTPLMPLCQPAKAVAQIRDGLVIFAPDEGTWVLEGVANPDGSLTADHSRIAANKQAYETTFEARWTPTAITGTYKTPRCTFKVDLSRS